MVERSVAVVRHRVLPVRLIFLAGVFMRVSEYEGRAVLSRIGHVAPDGLAERRLAVSARQNTVASMVRHVLNSRSKVGW